MKKELEKTALSRNITVSASDKHPGGGGEQYDWLFLSPKTLKPPNLQAVLFGCGSRAPLRGSADAEAGLEIRKRGTRRQVPYSCRALGKPSGEPVNLFYRTLTQRSLVTWTGILPGAPWCSINDTL